MSFQEEKKKLATSRKTGTSDFSDKSKEKNNKMVLFLILNWV